MQENTVQPESVVKKKKINYLKFMENYLYIRTKSGETKKFILNKPQLRLHNIVMEQIRQEKPIRIIILKARQMGFSTYVEALLFSMTILNEGFKTGIITHAEFATRNLFTMTKRYYQKLPQNIKPEVIASNAKEIIFNNKEGTGLDSEIVCMTATSDGVGRSSSLNALHCSELDYWLCDVNDVYSSLAAAIPIAPNTAIFIESTANGYKVLRDKYYEAVNKKTSFIPFFAGWNELDEYQLPYNNEEFTEDELEIQKRHNLTNEQMMWRRTTLRDVCNGDLDKFHRDYPLTPEEAFVATGNPFFEIKKVTARIDDNIKPLRRGFFSYTRTFDFENQKQMIQEGSIKFNESDNGEIKIYKEPERNRTYCLGGDPAGEGSDDYVGCVIDAISGEQVAVYEKSKAGDDIFGEMMYCLGRMYNYALIGIETNVSSYSTKILDPTHYAYPNLYLREIEDTYTKRLQKKFGFRTTSINRNNILIDLQRIVKEEIHLICDMETLFEMTTFIRNQNDRPEAMAKKHDDHIFALAIAHAIKQSGQCRSILFLKEEEEGSWIKQMMKKEKEESEKNDEYNFY